MTGPCLAHFQQIDSIRVVDVAECASERIAGGCYEAKSVVSVGIKLRRTVIQYPSNMCRQGAGGENDGGALAGVIVPHTPLQRHLLAFQSTRGRGQVLGVHEMKYPRF